MAIGVELSFRIIPALAGNTRPSESPEPTPRDHPRSRGEYLPRGMVQSLHHGSSPLSRGILDFSNIVGAPFGIIPALAGNTALTCGSHRRITDHPRSRGEYKAVLAICNNGLGSSPLSRGIRPTGSTERKADGIIPALAGNTVCLTRLPTRIRYGVSRS